jgi:hypothetical protein
MIGSTFHNRTGNLDSSGQEAGPTAPAGPVPLVADDTHERTWNPPIPLYQSDTSKSRHQNAKKPVVS